MEFGLFFLMKQFLNIFRLMMGRRSCWRMTKGSIDSNFLCITWFFFKNNFLWLNFTFFLFLSFWTDTWLNFLFFFWFSSNLFNKHLNFILEIFFFKVSNCLLVAFLSIFLNIKCFISIAFRTFRNYLLSCLFCQFYVSK